MPSSQTSGSSTSLAVHPPSLHRYTLYAFSSSAVHQPGNTARRQNCFPTFDSFYTFRTYIARCHNLGESLFRDFTVPQMGMSHFYRQCYYWSVCGCSETTVLSSLGFAHRTVYLLLFRGELPILRLQPLSRLKLKAQASAYSTSGEVNAVESVRTTSPFILAWKDQVLRLQLRYQAMFSHTDACHAGISSLCWRLV